MSQIVVLGPFTFTRGVAILVVIYAVAGVRDLAVMLAVVPIVLMMLAMQSFFDRLNRYPDFAASMLRREHTKLNNNSATP